MVRNHNVSVRRAVDRLQGALDHYERFLRIWRRRHPDASQLGEVDRRVRGKISALCEALDILRGEFDGS